eukprot:1036415-Prymnesium_polylepis.1
MLREAQILSSAPPPADVGGGSGRGGNGDGRSARGGGGVRAGGAAMMQQHLAELEVKLDEKHRGQIQELANLLALKEAQLQALTGRAHTVRRTSEKMPTHDALLQARGR